MEISDLLNQSEFFKGVSAKSKHMLAEVCIPKRVKKKQNLFLEGEKGHAVYLCATGNIQLYKLNPEGKETVIKIIGPGEIFAEVILFENDTYPVTATAIKESQVYVLPKNDFYDLLGNENFRNDFISMLMKKQRYLADQIMTLHAYNVEERFMRFLVSQYGLKEEYEITLSKKDIAAAIGTNPETLSRMFASLKKRGVMEPEGRIKLIPF
jgi:CRP/FNR family transcriptional regulator